MHILIPFIPFTDGAHNVHSGHRLGKLACPRVNDDQCSCKALYCDELINKQTKKEIQVDDQKLNSVCPHDYWFFGELVL